MTDQIAESSKHPWHTVSLKIPFHSAEHATIAKRAIEVDREQNSTFVNRHLSVEGDILLVEYKATTVRLLRLATNSFMSSLDLVMRTMEEFAPDPQVSQPTDEELEAIRRLHLNEDGVKGIELKGGKGAGGGEEVK